MTSVGDRRGSVDDDHPRYALPLVTAAFAATGLVGPLLWHATSGSAATGSFLDELLLLLWPARLLVMGWDQGAPVKEAIYIYGGQLGFFGALGLLVGLASRWQGMGVVIYGCVSLTLLLFAFWTAGFSSEYMNWLALVAAWGVYAVPFCLVRLITGRRRDPPMSD